MSKTHKEFLAYLDNIKDEDLKRDDVVLELVFEILDKLKRDFTHLANYLKEENDCSDFFTRPVLSGNVHQGYLATEYGGTKQDQVVLNRITKIMQACYLMDPFIHKDDAQQGERTNIQYEAVKQLHIRGYKTFIHLDVTAWAFGAGKTYPGRPGDTVDDLEQVPRILIDIGTMLVEL